MTFEHEFFISRRMLILEDPILSHEMCLVMDASFPKIYPSKVF